MFSAQMVMTRANSEEGRTRPCEVANLNAAVDADIKLSLRQSLAKLGLQGVRRWASRWPPDPDACLKWRICSSTRRDASSVMAVIPPG